MRRAAPDDGEILRVELLDGVGGRGEQDAAGRREALEEQSAYASSFLGLPGFAKADVSFRPLHPPRLESAILAGERHGNRLRTDAVQSQASCPERREDTEKSRDEETGSHRDTKAL